MSDITPMAVVPSEVNYGRIRANFVAFIADDNGNVLEEVPLEGNVILTPTVGVLRFPSTSPPRTAVIQTLQCPIIGGILYPPGTPLGGPFPSQTGVAAVASDQPAGMPTTVQWTASFSLENTSAQPNPVTFEVPTGGVVDLTTVMPTTPEPGIVVVVSTETAERAEAAADAADVHADRAETAADAAEAFADAADAHADSAEAARDTTLAAAIQELRGEGQPGSSAATNDALPGTYYTDTAGTAGAWRWLKVAGGSGTSKWQVVYGDTGWRDISADFVNGWSGTARIRRVGQTLNIEISDLYATTATSRVFYTAPVGFRSSSGSRRMLYLVTPSGQWCRSDWNVSSISVEGYDDTWRVRGLLTALTTDPWPTTLPGTPA